MEGANRTTNMANPIFCGRNLSPPYIFSGSLTVGRVRCEQMPPRGGIGVNESNTCWSKDQRYIRQKRCRTTNGTESQKSRRDAGVTREQVATKRTSRSHGVWRK